MEFQRSASSASSSFSSRFGDHSSLISSSLWPMDQNHCWMPVEHQNIPKLPCPACPSFFSFSSLFSFLLLMLFLLLPKNTLGPNNPSNTWDPIECKACTRVSAKGTVLLVFLILFACFVLLVLFVVVLRILLLLLLLCLVTLLLCLLVCFFCSVRLFAPWFKTKPEVRKPLHNLCFLCFFYRGLSQEKWICWIFAGLSSLPTHNQNHLTETNVSHDTSFQAPFPPFKIGKCGLPTRWT